MPAGVVELSVRPVSVGCITLMMKIPLQRLFAMRRGFGNVPASGVIVRDVSDPDQAFAQIRQMVDAGND